MAAPEISLTTTGTDPKLTTKQILESAVNTALETVWDSAIVAGMGAEEADALRVDMENFRQDAADAVTASEIAATGAKYYDTIAAGRAAVADTETFGVKAGGSDELTRPTLYRRDSSSTQTEIIPLVPGSEYDAATLRRNTTAAELAIRTMQGVDVSGSTIPSRSALAGVAWSLDPTVPKITLGLGRIPVEETEFSRSDIGSAIGGGAGASFAVNELRLHNDVLFLDGGGVNPVTTQDITNAYWTKTGLTTGSATNVAGEAGATSAKRIPEDTSTGNHRITSAAAITIPSSTLVVYNWIFDSSRDYEQADIYDAGTVGGVRGRWDLTGDGAFVAAYPALLGTGVSNPKGGIRKLDSGFWHAWLAVEFASAKTGIRPYLYNMSSSTVVSYTGDAGHWLAVEAQWANPGSLVPTSYVATSRAAETLNVALAEGYYLATIEDEGGARSEITQIDFEERYTLAPSANRYEIRDAKVRVLPMLDTFTRSNTSDGASVGLGETATPVRMLTYNAAFPMIAATHGRISGNALHITPSDVSAAARTFYATIDAKDIGGQAIKSARIEYSFGAASVTGAALSNTAIAIGFCNDPDAPDSTDRLIYNMPLHLVITRSGTSLQYRQLGESPFPVVGNISHTFSGDRAVHTTVVTIEDDTIIVTTDGFPALVVQDAAFAENCRFAFFEITSNTGNTTDTGYIESIAASPFGLADVPAYVAAAPVSHTAAVIAPATAGWVAGKTINVSVQPGVTSNAGAATVTGYLWQYLVGSVWTDLPATNNASTYVTVTPRDVGRVISCLLTVTNDEGSTQMRSASSSALT
jgi:hypothetical protein